jgi:putative peptide zinc metalloprotease protein
MMIHPAEEKAAEIRFLLPKVVISETEDLVRYWGEKCGLKDEVLAHLIFAVYEVVAAIGILASDLDIQEELIVKAIPYTNWLTVKLTFPKTVPLDPTFHTDEVPDEFPGMGFHPDIFWRQVIIKYVDKAVWEEAHGRKNVYLTQYARREGHPGELYFLNLTPNPAADLSVRFLSEGFALAVSPDIKMAYRLSREAAFVLRAVDGKTSMREIYRAFIEDFGLVNPRAVGRIIEELAQKGLIIPGRPLGEAKEGVWTNTKRVAEKVLAFKYPLRQPDAFLDALNRYLGWLWSTPASWVYTGFVVFTIWAFGFDLVPGGHIFVHLHNTPALLTPWTLLGLFWGFSVTVVIHELSHAMACRRLGGSICAFGIMLYYGCLAAYCDTSDAWRFPAKWHRIWVSVAGPFSTLVMGCLFGWANYGLTRLGYPTLGVFFGSLAFLSMLCVVFNLTPFLELDGYYICADFFEIPNLKKKSFNYLAALGKRVLGQGELPSLSAREKAVLLIYGLGSPLFALFLLTLPLYEFLAGHLNQAPRLLVWFGIFLILLFIFQLAILKGIHWYWHSHVMIVNLKGEADL